MEVKLYWGAILILLNVQRHRCQRAFSCSDPVLDGGDELYYRTEMEEGKGGGGYYMRDKQYDRTVFAWTVLDTAAMRDEHKRCDVDVRSVAGFQFGVPDRVGQIVPYEFGGTCNATNVFPQNPSCNKGLWAMYERWIETDAKSHDRIEFCARLDYAEDGDRRPTRIVSRTYSHPENKPLRSIAINNPMLDECERIPQYEYKV